MYYAATQRMRDVERRIKGSRLTDRPPPRRKESKPQAEQDGPSSSSLTETRRAPKQQGASPRSPHPAQTAVTSPLSPSTSSPPSSQSSQDPSIPDYADGSIMWDIQDEVSEWIPVAIDTTHSNFKGLTFITTCVLYDQVDFWMSHAMEENSRSRPWGGFQVHEEQHQDDNATGSGGSVRNNDSDVGMITPPAGAWFWSATPRVTTA